MKSDNLHEVRAEQPFLHQLWWQMLRQQRISAPQDELVHNV
jgi:hypothetical protein